MTGAVEGEGRLVFDRLTLRAAAWWNLEPETRDVIRASCLTKCIWSERGARHATARLIEEGEEVRAYRCPFGHPSHWHVGHVVPMAYVEKLARAIRDLAGDLPEKIPNRG